MSALAIRENMGSEELRRRIARAPRGWPGWTARPCVTGFTATTRKGSLDCAIGRRRDASRS